MRDSLPAKSALARRCLPFPSRRREDSLIRKQHARVLIAAPFPPPVHGFAVIMSAMADAIEKRTPVARVNLAAERSSKIGTHLAQMARCLAGCAAILQHRLAGGVIVAIGVNGGAGLLYTLALSLTARICRLRMTLHHHSYRYINRRSWLMVFLLRAAGSQAIHVFLSEAMAGSFEARYARSVRKDILNNAIFVPPNNLTRVPHSRPTAGLLSNLSREKGLHDFLRLAHLAKIEGIAMDFVLAGPAKLDSDRMKIEEAVAVGDVTWLGPLYGNAKNAFFAEIDVLVFPTRYDLEAQPTIIYEAFAAGTPVVSVDRGTIFDQVEDCLIAVDQNMDFVTTVAPLLKSFASSDGVERRRISDRARNIYAENTGRGESALDRLFPCANR